MKKIFTFILALVASVGISSAAITVRLDPSSCSDWSTVRLWAWTDEGNVFDSWPGQIVSKDGDGWYAYTFSPSITSVSIIWTNGTDQTVDIMGVTSSTCYKLNSQTGTAITVSVVDCSSDGGQGEPIVVSGTYKIGDLYYYLHEDKTAAVTYMSYDGITYNKGWNITTADIPASVTYSGTAYSVTSIGNGAFYGCSSLTSVTIPNSVTSIGWYAFEGCSSLTSVTIGNSVTIIGYEAFTNCSSLTSVAIPNTVTIIGYEAFRNCSSLTSVTIPNTVTIIGYEAFRGCSGLTSLSVEAGNTVYDSRNNCNAIIETATNTLIVGCQNTTIPNSVTSIGDYAFDGCSGLTSVTIPNSVTSIGDYAFDGCSGLTSVTIPNSVTSIGDVAFYGCSSLTSVTIPNSVTSIGDKAFRFCNSLSSIYVPCGELERFKQLLGDYSSYIKYAPYPYTITTNAQNGYISTTNFDNYTICDEPLFVTCTPIPDYGYHFVKWSDGNTDNPRAIELTQDITLTAEFAKNTYTISTTSANPEWGTTAGGKSALYLDEIEISATANYGYHFVQWSDREYICDDWWDGVCYYGHWGDYNIEPTRTIVVERDSVITATFAKNVYTITKNAEHGYISGNWEAEYLDEVTMTVVPDYGYHFTQWSDGNTDNPREIVLTQDTAFTAEFAVDRSGTCGNDYALTWSYNPTDKCLTIQGSGAFDQHIQYGVEAPGNMEKLIVSEGVTTIGASAFAYQATLLEVSLPTTLQTIGEQAFYNCTGLTHIYNFRERPCVAYSNSFDGIDKFSCTLHVLSASVDMYKAATAWRDFYYIQTIDATETTVATDKVSVEPTATTADVVWPAVENAATYELVIKDKNGNVVCTLIFNANGQLTQIAFNAPARDNTAQAAGFAFTVTGLEESTSYDLTITAKDGNGTTLDEKTIAFTTSSETGVEDINAPDALDGSTKILRNGQLLILRDGKTYTVQGQEVK